MLIRGKMVSGDKRSGKLVLVAHCALNQNSRALGLAEESGAMVDIVNVLVRNEVGIVQMPCPELAFAGALRKPQTREQYDNVAYRQHCKKLAEEIIKQAQEYEEHGIRLRLVIGISKSPSCGVGKPGILVEGLRAAMEARRMKVPMCDVSHECSKLRLREIEQLIRG